MIYAREIATKMPHDTEETGYSSALLLSRDFATRPCKLNLQAALASIEATAPITHPLTTKEASGSLFPTVRKRLNVLRQAFNLV